MPIYKLKLLDKKEIAQDTMEFVFEKPDGFSFIPGQYGGFTLIDSPITEPGGFTRRFSISSSPKDQHIALATRMQNSPYKNFLKEIPLGKEIKFAGPIGNFILHAEQPIPAVFIAGGIGITPFYSILKEAAQRHSSQSFTLFYGNQTIDDAAYLEELKLLTKNLPHFNLVNVLANPNSNWTGEKGFISYEIIKKYVTDLTTPIFYVCGSPAMVNALHETLQELDINEDRIKVEDFPGY